MRKILLYLTIIVTVMVGTFLATFYFFGVAAEHKFHKIISTISIFTHQDIKVTDYKRHWFSSDAVVTITFKPRYLLGWRGKDVDALVKAITEKSFLREVTIATHVQHGPFIYTAAGVKVVQALIDARLILNKEQNNLLHRNEKMPPLATMNMLVDIKGDGGIYVSSNKITYHKADSNMLWNGFVWHLDFSRRLDAFKSQVNFWGCELVTNKFSFKLGNFKFISNLHKIAGKILPSYKLFALPFVQFQNNGSDIVIDNLYYRSSLQKVAQDVLKSNAYLHIANVGVNNLNYRNINFSWHADKLNAKIFVNLIDAIMRMRQAEKFNGIEAAYCFELLLRLLNNDAVLNVDKLEMLTPWGKFNATANTVFKRRSGHSGWLVSLLANTQAKIDVKLEQGLALYLLQCYYQFKESDDAVGKEQANVGVALAMLLREGKLLVEDGLYGFSINYARGKLLLNNQPFSASSSVMMLLQ